MKPLYVLIAGLLAVILLNNLEEYLANPFTETASQDYDAVDYYLTNFSLSAVTASGAVSHTIDGQYMAFWHNRDASFIIAPRIVSKDDSANAPQAMDALTLTANEALVDHTGESIELNGDVRLNIAKSNEPQLTLTTPALKYQLAEKHISTDKDVRIVSPNVVLQGTGLDSKLDEAYLRLNANVRSTYQPSVP